MARNSTISSDVVERRLAYTGSVQKCYPRIDLRKESNMAVATAVHGGNLPANFQFHRRHPKPTCQNKPTANAPRPPLYISTNPTHVNPIHLRDLFTLCNHSCHRFPKVDPTGRVEPVDHNKLRIALSCSSLVVSAFARLELSSDQVVSRTMGIGGVWIQKMMPVTPENGRLVGFGRAVTDFGLTASIYDVTVDPSLQNRGIGRMIVQRIIRMLTKKGVYDIAALCSEEERPFFRACGFGDDILRSTTMMYTRTASSNSDNDQVVSAGRKVLLVPPIREHLKSPSPFEG